MIFILLPALLALALSSAPAGTPTMKRFYHSGDGFVHLVSEKNGKVYQGRYRDKEGRYSDAAYSDICAVFGAPSPSHRRVLSLRLIAFLDYLQDRLGPGKMITITSGYRAPQYNTQLRKGGALAAKASLHQYGMAVDLVMEGVSSKLVWEHVRALNFGGTGYYNGRTVHVDVGPARYWDQSSSGVGTGISDDNKLIGLVSDYDYYAPGDEIFLSFIRMTAFPIRSDPEFMLIPEGKGLSDQSVVRFKPELHAKPTAGCIHFKNIEMMASVGWRLPSSLPPGHYTIRAAFCGTTHEKMPKSVATPVFEVRLP